MITREHYITMLISDCMEQFLLNPYTCRT